ncbi:MAG: hypothetical protein SFY56_03430 [Bacteroidota bacterium]|nr:hypothetical protein [Bacteroidota bacterium]
MELSNTEIKRNEILKQIISKGGLLGRCANLYVNDKSMAHKFILECSEQAHHAMLIDYFGIDLISEIINYSKNFNELAC